MWANCISQGVFMYTALFYLYFLTVMIIVSFQMDGGV